MVAFASTASALTVNGELKKAQLENQTSDPSCATALKGRIYYDTVNSSAKICNGTTWESVGSGGSSAGGVNYITNGDAELASVPATWVTFDDGATATPVNGTGGTEATLAAVSRTTTAAQLISQTGTFKFSHDTAADGQGEGWSYDFQLPAKSPLLNQLVSFEFDYYFSTVSGAAVVAYVYDKDTSTLITPKFWTCGNGTTGSLSLTTSTCRARLQWVATSSDDYRIIFMLSGTTTTVFDMYVDNIFVGAKGVQVGSADGNLGNIGTTLNWNGASFTNQVMAKRDGEFIDIEFEATHVSGALSGNPYLEIPAAYAPDTSVPTYVASGSVSESNLGYGWMWDTSVQRSPITFQWKDDSPAEVWVLYQIASSTPVTESFVTTAAPFAMAAGDKISGRIRYRVAAWVGSAGAYGENNCEYVYNTNVTTSDDTTSFGYGPEGITIPSFTSNATGLTTKVVRFPSAIQSTDIINIEVSNGVNRWFRSDTIVPATKQHLTQYGILGEGRSASSTDFNIYFGKGGATPYNNATYGTTNTDPWSAYSAYKWRVKKCAGGQAVGFGLADSSGGAGLVAPYSSGSGVVYADTYTPTITNGTNVASSSLTGAQFMRVGKVFTASIMGAVTPTAAASTATRIDYTLPVASNLAVLSDCTGTGAADGNAMIGAVAADTTNDRIRMDFLAATTSARTWSIHFTCVIK